MAGLTRDALLGVVGHTVEAVEVPEWGGTVYVRTLTAGELLALDRSTQGDSDSPDAPILTRLLAACICDEAGAPLLEYDDAVELSNKPATVLYRLYRVACRLNGLDAAEGREKN